MVVRLFTYVGIQRIYLYLFGTILKSQLLRPWKIFIWGMHLCTFVKDYLLLDHIGTMYWGIGELVWNHLKGYYF